MGHVFPNAIGLPLQTLIAHKEVHQGLHPLRSLLSVEQIVETMMDAQ